MFDPLSESQWSNAREVTTGDGTSKYLIQRIAVGAQPAVGTDMNRGGPQTGGCLPVDVFRITGRGSGARGTTRYVQTLVQTPSAATEVCG